MLRISQDTGSILDKNTWRMVTVTVKWQNNYLKTGREDKVQWRINMKTTVVLILIHLLTLRYVSTSVRILVIKPTRCTNLFLEYNCICFGQFLCPSPGVIHCTHSNGICHTVLLTAVSNSKTVWHTPLLCVQWKTPDNGQGVVRNM